MTAEQVFLLNCMKLAVQKKHLQTLPENISIDWTALIAEAYSQTVSLPLFDVVSQLQKELPEEIYQKLFEQARRFTACNMRVEHAQAQLVSVLEQMNCPYVILKGETAAADYPVPELRQLGDVDFLAPEEHMAAITEKMQALGFRHSWEPGDYHQVLEKPGACLEMHMEVAGMPKGETRQTAADFFADIYESSRLLDRGFGPFRAPCQAHHGMILLLHMQHHVVAHGMGLRHIMDWACFVDKTHEEPFWQERLLPVLQELGLFYFTAVMTKMASLYFGSCCPDWAQAAEEQLCRDLMEDILSGGNFGRKDEDRSRAQNMLPDWEQEGKRPGKLKLLYKTLRHSALSSNPQLEGRPVALFFAMIGRALRYLVLFFRGERPNLLKSAAFADQRRSIYEQLRMFEKSKENL